MEAAEVGLALTNTRFDVSQISVLVSQVFVLSSNLGSTVGPALSANLAHRFGFTFAMISYAFGTFCFAVVSFVLTLEENPDAPDKDLE